jgi:subtilisin family serine protease
VLVAIDPDPMSLQLAARAGFGVLADDRDPELGLRSVTLAVPRNLSTRQGLKRLRSVAPRLHADFDHIYEPAGGELLPFAGALAASQGLRGGGPRIGIVDGGVASHPAMARASIEQNGFAGRPQPTGHGTAVASLIVGNQGAFQGAAHGASLFVADVYGGSRASGSASSIVRALGWLASKRPQVINISLVGPQNRLVERAVQTLRARGIGIVAAVGNDGPAAPPQYPASYPGVVAVTGVDARGRALPEAGKASHLDFAAPGADMAAALPGQGYAKVRGTSFAAPFATARLAIAGSTQRLAVEARPGKGRVGRGIVCGSCRIDPRAVRAK